jgi:predicted Zn finger-like uncharacterized protein
MIITCQECKIKLKIPDEKITSSKARVKCPKCQALTQIYDSNIELATTPKFKEEEIEIKIKDELTNVIENESNGETFKSEVEEFSKISKMQLGKDLASDSPSVSSIPSVSTDANINIAKKKTSYVKILVIIFVVLGISGAVFFSEYEYGFITQTYNILLQNKYVNHALTILHLKPTGVKQLSLEVEKAYFLKTIDDKNIYLVYGRLENAEKTNINLFKIEGTLIDSQNNPIKTLSIPVGVFFNEETVKQFKSNEEILEAYKDKTFNFLEMSFQLKQVPFMFVFYDVKDDGEEYRYTLKLIK